MIREIITFDGGLSTKRDATLIKNNEGVICENIELESGILKPTSSLLYVENIPSKYFTYLNDTVVYGADDTDIRHYAEFNNRLYWTNDSFSSFGLMRYDGTSAGEDAVAPSTTNLETNISDIILETYSDVNNDGRLTMGATYNYAFTLVDDQGIESAPVYHPTTITITTANKQSTKISISDVALDDWQNPLGKNVLPTGYSLKIYRIGGDNPTYNLINENITPTSGFVCVAGSTCIRDNIADINVARIELTTLEQTPPHGSLDMLVENNGTLWGAYRDRVYFSQTGSPEFWGLLDFIVLDDTCTGIGTFGDQIVAFTHTSAYLITGFNRDNIVKERLPFNEGCINQYSIANIGHYILWTSHNGVCLFDGSNISIITKDSLSWDEFGRLSTLTYGDFDGTDTKWSTVQGFEISFATAFQDKYYGIYSGGCMIIDVSNGIKISTINLPNVASLAINAGDNVLMFAVDKGDSTYDLYARTDSRSKMEAVWKTGEITGESNSIKKHYRQVELDGTPTYVKVYIDGVLKHTATAKDKFMLPAGCFGRHIQFEISTHTDITTLKYQYSIMKA